MALRLSVATPERLAELCEVDVAAWGEAMAATDDMLAMRLARNVIGNFMAIHEESGRIAGTVWTQPIADQSVATWMQASGNGVYDNMIADGPVLFGVNISVHRGVSPHDPVGPFLLAGALAHARDTNRRFARTGARMPGFNRGERPWSKLFTAEDYVALYQRGPDMFYVEPIFGFVRQGPPHPQLLQARNAEGAQLIDPAEWTLVDRLPADAQPFDFELRFFCGVEVEGNRLEIKRVLPNYFEDAESANNGVLLEWRNPLHV